MASPVTQLAGTIETVLSTGASLANNALALSSAYTPASANYIAADLELTVTFSTSPTLATGLAIWFITAADGSNYEDGSSSLTPGRPADMMIPWATTTSAQRLYRYYPGPLPTGAFKVLAKNEGSGQTMGSGWVLKLKPRTLQVG